MKRQSALVVFSGGQDSTTCLFWALKHYETVELVTFAYGQRHSLEIEVAKEIAQEQGLKHHVLDMSLLGQITENALTSDIEIEAEEGEVPNTFVDGRNHLFLSFHKISFFQTCAASSRISFRIDSIATRIAISVSWATGFGKPCFSRS